MQGQAGLAATLILFPLLLLAAPPAADAQTGRVFRVGLIGNITEEGRVNDRAFDEALRELGYVEGRNLVLDRLYADREGKQVPALVAELIARKPDVLVSGESGAKLMRAQTTTIPIVMVWAIDPVAAGLVQSLRRPGTNVTGTAQLHDLLPAKHVSLAREILPRLKHVGMFVDGNLATCRLIEKNAREAAHAIGAAFSSFHVANRAEIEKVYQHMEKERPDILLPCPSGMLYNYRDLLFANAARLRIPYTSFVVDNVPHGVLFANAASQIELQRRAATYVHRILQGANPAELPIEQPTRFDLVISLGTARAMGIVVPQSVLLRADRVVE